MWQTKYASAVPKNLGLGFDFRSCSEGDFLTRRPQSVLLDIEKVSTREFFLSLIDNLKSLQSKSYFSSKSLTKFFSALLIQQVCKGILKENPKAILRLDGLSVGQASKDLRLFTSKSSQDYAHFLSSSRVPQKSLRSPQDLNS